MPVLRRKKLVTTSTRASTPPPLSRTAPKLSQPREELRVCKAQRKVYFTVFFCNSSDTERHSSLGVKSFSPSAHEHRGARPHRTSTRPAVPDGAQAVLEVGPLLSCPLEVYSLRPTRESGQTPRICNNGRRQAAPRPSPPLLLSPHLCSQSHPLPDSTARNPSPSVLSGPVPVNMLILGSPG